MLLKGTKKKLEMSNKTKTVVFKKILIYFTLLMLDNHLSNFLAFYAF